MASNVTEPLIEVSPTLQDPHPLVAAAFRRLSQTRAGRDGYAKCREGASCLAVHVAPSSVDRALRIMDALLKSCEARGFPVEVTDIARFDARGTRINAGVPINKTRLLIHGQWVTVKTTHSGRGE